jgi:WD40 repeat protein
MKPVNSLAASAAVAVVALFATSALLVEQPKLRDTLRAHDPQVSSVIFSPDGQTLASSSGLTTRIWDLTSGKSDSVASRFAPNAPFSADGQTLLLCGASSYPKQVYDVKSGKTTTVIEAPGTTLIAFSPDGRTEVLSRGFNDFGMRHLVGSFDLSTGQSAVSLTGAAFPGLKQSATFSLSTAVPTAKRSQPSRNLPKRSILISS